jgi:hypothetical protein
MIQAFPVSKSSNIPSKDREIVKGFHHHNQVEK